MDTDAASIERLLRERTWLRRLAGVLARDAAEADDLAQQAWVAALERRPREVRSPRAWLATVLRNLARDRARGEARRRRRETQRPVGAPIPQPDELAARAELTERVGRQVLALEEPYREAILLRFHEDLPPRRIAAHLGVPVETVRTRVKRGLAILARRLDAEHLGSRRAWAVPLLLWAKPSAPAWVGASIGGIVAVKKTVVVLALACVGVLLVTGWTSGLFRGAAPKVVSDADVGPFVPSSVPEAPSLRGTDEAPDPASLLPEGEPSGCALVGRVLYPGRVPAPGVRVQLYAGEQAITPDDVTTTDAAGRFRLRPRPPLKEGYNMFRLAADDGKGNVASREKYNVKGTCDTDVEAPRLVLEPGYAFRVRIESEGSPVPGAQVEISNVGYQRHSRLVRTTTDDDGRVRIDGFLPMLYRVKVEAVGLPTTYALVSLPQEGEDPYRIVLDPPRTIVVEVVEAPDMTPLSGIEVRLFQRLGWANTYSEPRLDAPGSIAPTDARGRTEIADVGCHPDLRVGVVVRGYARPVFTHATKTWSAYANKTVPLPPDEDLVRVVVPAGRRVTWPLVEGDARIPPDGTIVRLDVGTSGMRPVGVETGVVENGRLVVDGLVPGYFTARGQTPSGLVARIVALPKEVEGAPLSFWRPRTLEVVIRRADGSPLTKVSVRLEAEDGPQITTPFAHPDEDGVARWEGLPALRGSVRADALPDSPHRVDLTQGDQRLEVRGETPEETRRYEVAIRVLLDGIPGLPDEYKLRVADYHSNIACERESEADATLHARWWTEPGKDGGAFTLLASGYQPALFDLRPGAEEVEVRLERGCALRVRFLHEPGKRPRYRVERYDEAQRTWKPFVTSGTTRLGLNRVALNPPLFGFENRYDTLPPGRYRFVEHKLNRTSDVVMLTVGAAPALLTFDCRPGSKVEGRVVIPPGYEVAESIVELVRDGVRSEVRVDEKGAFSFPWSERATSVGLTARHPLLGPHPEQGRVMLEAPAEDLRLVLVPGPIAEVAFRVETTGEERLVSSSKRRVHLLSLDDPNRPPLVLPARIEQDEGGAWRLSFGGYEPGTWTLWAEPGYNFAPVRLPSVVLGELDPSLGPVTVTVGSTIRIRVETEDGKPPPLLVAKATFEGTPSHERHEAAVEEAEIVLRGLEAGRYRVRAGPVDPIRDEPPTAVDEVIEVDGHSTYERVIVPR